jgi:hypothetical protein
LLNSKLNFQTSSNALFLTDKNGLPLAMSFPVSGNHNDLFNIENVFPEMLSNLEQIGIKSDGLFMNADAGFDSKSFHHVCEANGIVADIDFNKKNSKSDDYEHLLNEQLYKEHFSVERTNAWIAAFKILLVRFETKVKTWASLRYLAFIIILLRKHFGYQSKVGRFASMKNA